MKTYHDLPAPSAAALTRSVQLEAIIRQKIQDHNGQIAFADYMELALYYPELGYYQQPDLQLGKGGDFTTAPQLSPLFAYCLARQCREVFAASGTSQILEIGAGSGQLALDLLIYLESLNCPPTQYLILEKSTGLKAQQRAKIESTRPDLLTRIVWLEALPSAFEGVIIANELLDAIPFQRFIIQQGEARECVVGLEDMALAFQAAAPTDTLAAELNKLHITFDLSEGYQSEIQLPAMNFTTHLCKCLKKGVMLIIDYGYGQAEYYHPQRRNGTLTCFYQHHQNQQPLQFPGLQDMTTHIDFTRVIETASDAGCDLLGFTTQSAFLLANGLLEEAMRLEATLPLTEQFKLHQAIKTLTMPTEMGETIKVMGISRDHHHRLTGFSTLDRRRDL